MASRSGCWRANGAATLRLRHGWWTGWSDPAWPTALRCVAQRSAGEARASNRKGKRDEGRFASGLLSSPGRDRKAIAKRSRCAHPHLSEAARWVRGCFGIRCASTPRGSKSCSQAPPIRASQLPPCGNWERSRLRLVKHDYRQDHVRAFAQRVEVADDAIYIRQKKRPVADADSHQGSEMAGIGVPGFIPNWRRGWA